MDLLKKDVVKALSRAVPKLSGEEILSLLEKPPNPEFGDLAFACYKLSSLYKKKPNQIALELEKNVKAPKSIEKVKAIGPYLNFFAKKDFITYNVLSTVLKHGKKFGSAKEQKQKILTEFVSPNTNKPLHLGHLRNAALGESISRLLESQGNKVVRVSIYNDRGIHICKSMLAYKKWGKDSTPKNAKKKPDHFVGEYYVLFAKQAASKPKLEEEALEELKKWEKGDKSTRALWKKMLNWCIQGFHDTLKRFGTKFDEEYFESNVYKEGKKIVLSALRKGVLEKQANGAVIAPLKDFGLPNKVLLRPDGTSIYMTQDINLAQKKFRDHKMDKSIYVVGSEQNLYFRQLFKILELIGAKWAKEYRHLSYGMIYLPEGKMKSREGKVVDADNILDEVEAYARLELLKRYPTLSEKEIIRRAKIISLSAVKFFLLKTEAQKDFVFNPKESISFEGQTGPYVMYSYARAKSILRRAGNKRGKPNCSLLREDAEKQLMVKLSEYPKALKQSLSSYSPHTICQYVLDLCESFNSYYHSTQVIQGDKELQNARLALVEAVATVIGNACSVLGMELLEEM